MSRIRTVKQTGTKTTAVKCNAYDSVIETVNLTDSTDTSFVFQINNSVVQKVSSILLSTEYNASTDYTTRTVTLTGTSGTANITVGGTNYLATFTTNLTTSANNFVTSHATALLARGIVVTANAGVLTFKALTSDFPTIARTNVSGDLSGTIASASVIATTGVPIATLESYERGLMKVRVTNVGSSALNSYARVHFKITHN